MFRAVTILLGLAIFLAAAAVHGQEEPVKSRIVSVQLFKNGLAVVKRELTVKGPGTYRLEDVPEPVHGTWWIESTAKVETAAEMREMDVPVALRPDPYFQEDLAGKNVVVHFKGGKLNPMNGTVLKLERPKGEADRGPGRFLILKTAKGQLYLDTAEIGAVEVEGATDTVKLRKPVLLFTVAQGEKNGSKIHLTYLARGLAWAPSYRVDITDPKTLTLELATVVKNELADLQDAEIQLISGFPSVQFANVTSPLSPHVAWSDFFNQLRARPQSLHDLQSQASTNNTVNIRTFLALDLSATPMGEGVDLHFQSIGKRTLGKGKALSLSLAKEKAGYERIVEWLIPDNRDEHGRYRGRGQDADEDTEDAWDALRFKNPFSFPMTTGPAMVTANGRFNGQRLSHYVSAGEETILRITKALSLRTRSVEQELLNKNEERDIVYLGGNRYRKSLIAAELTISNHRKEDVKLVIRRRFSGDLLTAEGAPRSVLREEGVYSVNKRNELIWSMALKGGEEKQLHYRYSVLVSH